MAKLAGLDRVEPLKLSHMELYRIAVEPATPFWNVTSG